MCDCAKKQLIYRRGDRWVTTGGHGVNFSVQADGKASDMRYVIIIIVIFFFLSKLQSANTNRQRTHRHSRIDNQN